MKKVTRKKNCSKFPIKNNAPLRVVLDTNVLLRTISRRSAYAVILDKVYENAFDIYITNDILLEYEEKISDIFSNETDGLIIGAL